MNSKLHHTDSSIGMALMCDEGGFISKILQNDFELSDSELLGKHFPTVFCEWNLSKALSFVLELKRDGRFFDCELDLPIGNRIVQVHCAGLSFDNGLLVIAAETRSAIQNLFDGMMQINNEQTNLLRQRAKIESQQEPPSSIRTIELFDDITSTNNELMNLQRELYRKNAELERLTEEVQALARTDQLTGLLNRRGFFEFGNREVALANRFKKPLAAIMLDVDHFKSFNDTYGHATGDRVLREVAQRCLGNVRDVDIIGRYGGEEFAVLLPESNALIGESTAERVRCAVADTPFETEHGPLRVTISLGVAVLNDQTRELADLLKLADHALYRAKELGRNRVSAWSANLS